jgi:hypothetical protein
MTAKKSTFHTSSLADEQLTFISLDNDGTLIVENDLGRREIYQQNDDYAGWTLEYNGHQYEFCRSA